MSIISELSKLKQENRKFEVTHGYLVRPGKAAVIPPMLENS